MRLTLRTLLAYMDDLLEPQDAIQMGKRIEENKVATELVHRIRTRMRLLRLGAPKVDGKGLGADANTVAEYLDNSLAAERVPDFEKMCLESDMHLAEAASCHQILAAVLDKPAVVDPALRLRVYNLIARADDFAEASAAESLHSELDLGDLAGVKAATAFPNEADMLDFIRNGSAYGAKYGIQGQGSGRMPGYGSLLTDEQIAAIVEYVRGL